MVLLHGLLCRTACRKRGQINVSRTILVISSSLRKGSNSDQLARSFERGALEAGHAVEYVSLRDIDIAHCVGCLGCHRRGDGHCFMHDDVDALVQKMRRADVIAVATPVYFYGLSAQLKAVLDRTNPLYKLDYAFRDIYLLSCAAEPGDHAFEKTRMGLEGWIECFPQARLAGSVCAGCLEGAGAVAQHPELLERAYQLGHSV